MDKKKATIQRIAALRKILAEIPGTNSNIQRRRMGKALEVLGSLTTYEAMRHLDIYDPRPRKFELVHRHGWGIITVMEANQTESGETHWIGRYVLAYLPPVANDERYLP